jgi:hypothetical protein
MNSSGIGAGWQREGVVPGLTRALVVARCIAI